MTQEEKHALIAEFEGMQIIDIPFVPRSVRFDQSLVFTERAAQQWISAYPRSIMCNRIPKYSSDLNLCARVEAKIAEMGDEAKRQYRNQLWDREIIEDDRCQSDWWLISAPPAARVDAMVALIQSLEEKK